MIRRIRDRATFEALARAHRHQAGVVSLRYVPGPPGSAPRVAYAVGRWAGNAVTRNRIRRRLRAAIERSEDRMTCGGAYLFSASRAAATTPFDALTTSIRVLLDQVEKHAQ